jgi:fatty acid desaturase
MTRRPTPARAEAGIEWPTLALLLCTYAVWAAVTAFAADIGLWLAVPLLGLALAQHSSLQHEVIHGHPTADQRLNDALVFPALGLLIP